MENNVLASSIEKIINNCSCEELSKPKNGKHMPSRDMIIKIIKDIRDIMFPGYFCDEEITDYFLGHAVSTVYKNLKKQIELAILYGSNENCACGKISDEAERISKHMILMLPEIQTMLLKDIQAGYDGDPAAKSKEEIIYSYPGLFAIFVYRVAHVLYNQNVPFIPRIMTEYAHGHTGIDINSGAQIGEYFFIDHGTGVVIGETTVIGNRVKIYQGVTLGALSTRSGQKLAGIKRHPTIEDNCTIYSGASVLGGETVIGEGSIIGGNCFITESIPKNTKVSMKMPPLIIKGPKEEKKSPWEI